MRTLIALLLITSLLLAGCGQPQAPAQEPAYKTLTLEHEPEEPRCTDIPPATALQAQAAKE